MLIRALLVLVTALLCGVPSYVFAAASETVKTPRVTAQLVAEHASVVPGANIAIALRLKHIPHWHTYWRNPGDSGLPTTIAWQLPDEVRAGDIQWPAPQRLPFGPLTNFGYEGEVWLLSDVRVPPGYAASSLTLKARAEWLVCSDICIPETGDFTLTLPVSASAPAVNRAARTGFAAMRARIPAPGKGWEFGADTAATGAVLRIQPAPGVGALKWAHYFPFIEGQIEPSAPQPLRRVGTGYALELSRAAQATVSMAKLHGVLVYRNAGVDRAVEVESLVAGVEVASDAGSSVRGPDVTFVAAVLFAFLGGIILNAMPCVFPILSIKVLGFAHETNTRRARRHGVFYAVGVILSFWLLAILLLGLRAAGQQIGWGFQLQAPAVVIFLALLFFLFGLNLLGVFEMGHVLPSSVASKRARTPDRDALLSGVLAVAVASPCTAPFMGAALGYAITQSNATSLAVFTALGVGMALPYVLLAWFPHARRVLPKPGAWMERLRQLLAFPLFATVIWLLWVLGVQLGVAAITYMLMALLFTALAVVLLRWAVKSNRHRMTYGSAGFAAAAAFAAAIAAAGMTADPVAASPTNAWAPYSPDAVSKLNADGKTVFVDFTAAWCITCQVNKKLVLDTTDIRDALSTRDTATLRADWTHRDPVITQALESMGRSGVPAYLIQRPGQPPQLLPELLTKKIVLRGLDDGR